jgi:hypothetical protein
MQLLQEIYIRILEPIRAQTVKVNETARDRVVWVCAFLLVAILLVRFQGLHRVTFLLPELQWNIMGSAILFVMILFSMKDKLRKLEANRVFSILYFVPILLVLFSSFDHYTGDGYRSFSLMILFGFPCLYFVWGNRGDHEKLFAILSWAFIWGGVALYVSSLAVSILGIEPIQFVAYSGVTTNQNLIGHYAGSVILCSLYLLYSRRNAWVFLCSMLAVSAFMLLLSSCRMALLATCANCLIFLVSTLKRRRAEKPLRRTVNKNTKNTRKKTVIVIAVVIVIVIGGVALNSPSATDSPFAVADENNRLVSQIARSTALFKYKLSVDERTLDQLTSYRWEIWVDYLEGITIRGKDYNAFPIHFTSSEWVHSAHNFPINFAYRCGLFSGALFLLFELLALFFSLRHIFRKRAPTGRELFLGMVVASFFLVSMLEVTVMSFYLVWQLLFYLCLGTLMFKPSSETKKWGGVA